MNDEYENLYVGGGFQTRLSLKDCEGDWVTNEDVSAVTYTIYKRTYGDREAVEGHENVTVSSGFITPEQDPHTGEMFNFKHKISQSEHVPFPEHNAIYIISYSFYDLNGTAHIHEITGVTS